MAPRHAPLATPHQLSALQRVRRRKSFVASRRRTFWRPRLAALRAPTVEAGRPLALAEDDAAVPVAAVYALRSLTCAALTAGIITKFWHILGSIDADINLLWSSRPKSAGAPQACWGCTEGQRISHSLIVPNNRCGAEEFVEMQKEGCAPRW